MNKSSRLSILVADLEATNGTMSNADGVAGSRPGWAWLALWGVLVAVGLAVRPLLPVDETRYLSVAWEMWRRSDWIVPYLNGAPYTDKPPLLFWGILLGWRAFGVNEWWPRLLSPLCGLLGVLLLARLVRRLSPDRPDAADHAVPFLSGALWVTYSTLVLFDALLATCVLIALGGVVDALHGRPGRGWLVYGVGIGLGVLAKGPVVLVHVLPVALLAPWWVAGSQPVHWRRWYLGLVAGLALGAAIGLAWGLAAAARAGEAYRAAIFWEQSAGRVVNAFAHRRPWWWYFPLLPLILFPWLFWPPLWRAFASLRRGPVQVPTRFALAWAVPGLIVFSSISGKQVHYLMPLLPAFALLAGTAYRGIDGTRRRWDAAVPAGVVAIGGSLLLANHYLHPVLRTAAWTTEIAAGWGFVLLVGALLLILPKPRHQEVLALSGVSPVLLLVVCLAGKRVVARQYDLRPAASFVRGAETASRPVAYVGRYAGQLHFLGRLEHPFAEIPLDGVAGWLADHPEGVVLRYERSQVRLAGAFLAFPYRDGMIGVWAATPDARSRVRGELRIEPTRTNRP